MKTVVMIFYSLPSTNILSLFFFFYSISILLDSKSSVSTHVHLTISVEFEGGFASYPSALPSRLHPMYVKTSMNKDSPIDQTNYSFLFFFNLAILRPGISGNVGPSLPSHYSVSMSYHPRPSSAMDGSLQRRSGMSGRDASHRRSVNSLHSRRSMKRSRGGRSSTRSTASQRRRKRMQRANHHPNQNGLSFDPDYDTYGSVYQSQNQLINSHYDVSSLDSFNPNGGHANPLYGGSLQSTGSRFSLYTLNPHATVENINVSGSHYNIQGNSSHSQSTPHHTNNYRDYRPADQPATIGRRSRRPRSPIYMNNTMYNNETVM